MKTNASGLTLEGVLFLLGMQVRTGELLIESGNNIGTMLLHRGKILQASSPYSRAIGDLLVEDGLISDADLIETLKLQKRNEHMPLGGLLLKMGKITFEVIEMMVHEQIRQAMKEFRSWESVNLSFLDKDLKPYDRISLGVQEFIPPAIFESAKAFLSIEISPGKPTPAPPSPTLVNP